MMYQVWEDPGEGEGGVSSAWYAEQGPDNTMKKFWNGHGCIVFLEYQTNGSMVYVLPIYDFVKNAGIPLSSIQ